MNEISKSKIRNPSRFRFTKHGTFYNGRALSVYATFERVLSRRFKGVFFFYLRGFFFAGFTSFFPPKYILIQFCHV